MDVSLYVLDRVYLMGYTEQLDNKNMANYGKYDFHEEEDFDNQDVYECNAEVIEQVLDRLKVASEFLMLSETAELAKHYQFLYPAVDGVYTITENRVHKLASYMFNLTANELVKKGVIELLWSDKENDFVFKIKDDGVSGA
jgi:hypothetical protein